jgi:choline dehydrogenase-like flavoprotein
MAVSGCRPNRESRITLSDSIDVNGLNRIRLDWNLQSEDFNNIFELTRMLAIYLGASNQGRLKIDTLNPPDIDRVLSVGMHHMCTTRMAENVDFGVVDKNCKVFGTNDLYVAGSSVFSTPGYSNPTLTIVALAVRLANHIAKKA